MAFGPAKGDSISWGFQGMEFVVNKNIKINLLATAGIVGIAVSASTAAHAQSLTNIPFIGTGYSPYNAAPVSAGTPTYDPGETGSAGDPVVTLLDEAAGPAGGTQSVVTSTRDETVTNSGGDTGSVGLFGQNAFYSWSASADTTVSQTSSVTSTSTPNGEGSFTVVDGTPTEWTNDGDPTVSNVSIDGFIGSQITSMYAEQIQTLDDTNDGTADVVLSGGIVSTNNTSYYTSTGTATYDAANSEVVVQLDSARATEQSANGFYAQAQTDSGFSSTSQTAAGFNAYDEDALGSDGTTVAANFIGLGSSIGEDSSTDTTIVGGSMSMFSGSTGDYQTADFGVDGISLATNDVTTFSVDSTGNAFIANGLDMNDTVISSVADGVAAGDAVNKGQLDAEALARADADVTLQGNIDAEAATRLAADETLQDNIDAEAATRLAADNTLQANITAEASTRAAADTTLQANITAEAATRAAADTAESNARVLADNTETAARAAADTTLQSNITAEANARIAADTAESNARIAADNALGSRITNETNDRIAADNLLRNQIASSTATAIALGGNTILPDSNFSLSGNMGFYQGAQAVAVNFSAKVSEKAYVTGAVGGGLNKDGKLGGRVGFVFGF